MASPLPQYLIIHIKRFSKNTQQYVEKNPTIVNFPVRHMQRTCSAHAACAHAVHMPHAQRVHMPHAQRMHHRHVSAVHS